MRQWDECRREPGRAQNQTANERIRRCAYPGDGGAGLSTSEVAAANTAAAVMNPTSTRAVGFLL